MRLALGGLHVEITLSGAWHGEHLHHRFGRYVVDEGCPVDLRLSLAVDPRWQPPRPVVSRYPGVDFLREPDGTLAFLRPDGETRVHLGRHEASAVVRPTIVTEDPDDDVTPLDTPLRLQVASELPGRQGAMVHACGYADERGAVLFVARSGGGKTTTARKLPRDHVLSDDLVAVRRTPAGWDACSLPFVGEWRRATVPRRARLRALVFLRKSEELAAWPTPHAAAFADTLQSMVWFARGDPGAAALLDHADALVRAVPCVTLSIPRDAPVLPLLDRWLA